MPVKRFRTITADGAVDGAVSNIKIESPTEAASLRSVLLVRNVQHIQNGDRGTTDNESNVYIVRGSEG